MPLHDRSRPPIDRFGRSSPPQLCETPRTRHFLPWTHSRVAPHPHIYTSLMFSSLPHTLPPPFLWFRSGKEGQMIYIYTLARLRVSARLLCISSSFSSFGYFISNHKSSTLQDESMMGSGRSYMFSIPIFVLRLAQTWFPYLPRSLTYLPHRTMVTKYDARSRLRWISPPRSVKGRAPLFAIIIFLASLGLPPLNFLLQTFRLRHLVLSLH